MVNIPILTVIILALFITTNGAPVQQFNPKKFDKSLKSKDYTLIYFYSASCKYCQTFTPKFQQASKIDLAIDIAFGKVDGAAYPELTEKYQIYSYPAIALFWKGIDEPIYYYKERQTQQLLEFIKIATKSLQSQINPKQYKKLSKQVRNQGIFYRGPKQGEAYRVISVLSFVESYKPFLRINSSESEEPTIEVKGQKYNNFDVKQLKSIIQREFARVFIIQEQPWLRIHQKKHPGVIYVDTQKNKQTVEILEELARQLPYIVFMKLDPGQQQFEAALSAFGIDSQENIFGVLKNADGIFQAQKPHTKQGLTDFIGGFMNLTLPVYRKSEKQGDKYKLTRKNYETKVNENKDVIVFLYKDDDKMKKNILQLFKFLTVKLKGNQNLSLLRCNLSKNEIQQKIGFQPKRTPSVFYLRHRMKDYPIQFNQRTLSLSTIIQFIMENTTFDWDDNWSNLDEL